MAKATHKGTCQICGNVQKLPNGRLSNHGYTVRWGWFEGTCHGAKGLPFEQSTDLIEGMIERCKQQVVDLKEKIEVMDARTDNFAPVTHYHRRNYKDPYSKSGYELYMNVEIVSETKTFQSGDSYTFFDRYRLEEYGDKLFETNSYSHSKSVAEEAKSLRTKYIENTLKKRIKQLEDYITWQTERVENWEEKPLIEL